MKEFSNWKDKEVKRLFEYIEKAKIENKSLLEGFKKFAEKTKRKANSVRNYYYLEVESLKKDQERAKKLGININLHTIQSPDKFSDIQTENLITEILRLKCLGYSIRRACLKLANNSAEEMLRYQNKFRSVMNKNKPLYNKCFMNLKENGLLNQKNIKNMEKIKENPKNSPKNTQNVIYMKKPEEKKLSDEDIKSLFFGLVKLVKNSAIDNIEKNLISEAEFANNVLRDNLIKIASLEKEIQNKGLELETEKEKNEYINEENFKLKTEIANLIGEKMSKNYKNKSLTKYLRDIRDKGVKIKTKI